MNPQPGGARFTNRHSAKRYVQRGHATWQGEGRTAIRFNEPKSRMQAIESKARAIQRERQVGYDRINRMMSLDELAALPVIMPHKLLRGARNRAQIE